MCSSYLHGLSHVPYYRMSPNSACDLHLTFQDFCQKIMCVAGGEYKLVGMYPIPPTISSGPYYRNSQSFVNTLRWNAPNIWQKIRAIRDGHVHDPQHLLGYLTNRREFAQTPLPNLAQPGVFTLGTSFPDRSDVISNIASRVKGPLVYNLE